MTMQLWVHLFWWVLSLDTPDHNPVSALASLVQWTLSVSCVWSCCGGKAAPATKAWSVNRVWSSSIYPEKFMFFSPDQSFTRTSSISAASAQSEKPCWLLCLFSACSGLSSLFNSCFIPDSFSWLGMAVSHWTITFFPEWYSLYSD